MTQRATVDIFRARAMHHAFHSVIIIETAALYGVGAITTGFIALLALNNYVNKIKSMYNWFPVHARVGLTSTTVA